MHLVDLGKLEAAGGLVLQRYREVTAEADASAFGSPAFLAKAQFEKDWEQRPNELAEEVRELNVARAEAAELAARSAGN
jgi:hypothetical protein